MLFGKVLRELRLDKGLTQKQLAEMFNVHHTTIRDWEIRGKEPSYETLCKLAEFFDVPVGYLLGVED